MPDPQATAIVIDRNETPSAAKFRCAALARWDNEGGALGDRSPDASIVLDSLPPAVRGLAVRLGAQEAGSSAKITTKWSGAMTMKPGGHATNFSARQTTALTHPEFAWRASFGPFGSVSVVDALSEGRGRLDVRLFGLFRLAHADGPATDKGEIMRYLAELAWAPDAILANDSLDWTVVDGRTLRVASGKGPARGEVEFHLDEDGRVASIRAEDRPAVEGESVVERPWVGRFSDYRKHRGRWLPFAGEVGWVLDGREFVYWRGKLLQWSIA